MKIKFLLFFLIILSNNAFGAFNKVKLYFESHVTRDTLLELTAAKNVIELGNPIMEEEEWNRKKFYLITFYMNGLYTEREIEFLIDLKFKGIDHTRVDINQGVGIEFERDLGLNS